MVVKVLNSEIPPELGLQENERVTIDNGAEATVIEVGEKETVLDFNPLLAGETLIYDVELLDLTKANLSSNVSQKRHSFGKGRQGDSLNYEQD